ncbi:hypothetical protein NKG05_18645 [Oerskovia sp. M15]
MCRPHLTASVTVWCAHAQAAGARMAAWLTSAEATKASAFRQAADRERFVTGRALVRAALGERLGVPPPDVVVRLSPRDGATPGGRSSTGRRRSRSPTQARGSWSRSSTQRRPGAATRGRYIRRHGRRHGRRRGRRRGRRVHRPCPGPPRRPRRRGPRASALRGWTAESFTRSWVRREAVLKAVGTGLLAPRDDLLLAPPTDLRRSCAAGARSRSLTGSRCET